MREKSPVVTRVEALACTLKALPNWRRAMTRSRKAGAAMDIPMIWADVHGIPDVSRMNRTANTRMIARVIRLSFTYVLCFQADWPCRKPPRRFTRHLSADLRTKALCNGQAKEAKAHPARWFPGWVESWLWR